MFRVGILICDGAGGGSIFSFFWRDDREYGRSVMNESEGGSSRLVRSAFGHFGGSRTLRHDQLITLIVRQIPLTFGAVHRANPGVGQRGLSDHYATSLTRDFVYSRNNAPTRWVYIDQDRATQER